jgi:hypothetical protein
VRLIACPLFLYEETRGLLSCQFRHAASVVDIVEYVKAMLHQIVTGERQANELYMSAKTFKVDLQE